MHHTLHYVYATLCITLANSLFILKKIHIVKAQYIRDHKNIFKLILRSNVKEGVHGSRKRSECSDTKYSGRFTIDSNPHTNLFLAQ